MPEGWAGARKNQHKKSLFQRPGAAVATNILIVDDNALLAASVSMVLRTDGTDHVIATSGRRPLEEVEIESIDLIIVDATMSGTDPLRVITELRRRAPDIPVIATRAYALPGAAVSPAVPTEPGTPSTLQNPRDLVMATTIVASG
jgi:CheY-like chemotaxis protein